MKTVSVLGMVHEMHETEFKDHYSLKEVDTVIRRFKPDVILAELWPGEDYRNLPDFKLEYKQCIYPLAQELDIKVLPVDYGSPKYYKNFRKWEKDKHSLVEMGEVKQELYHKVDDVIFSSIPKIFKSAKEINSEACNDIMQVLMDIDHLWFFKNQADLDFWEKHNEENYNRIMESIRNSNDERFLITFGLQHKYWFERKLKKETGIEFEAITHYCD
ncbi:hypothetical protein [Isachenkonia alkalipeptolytica]|uniref:Uncharacterized protein n=1 Tax=Isachenkonia alkalipeptolytica TaxID=2565777 RepID=A0AA43XN04_9CLOT|nr:hypothetical protein [Isachenkonia alkalipeptolytica]NBG89695.1 hypothetical protein [Isachenkonia alkalipeptolytica]